MARARGLWTTWKGYNRDKPSVLRRRIRDIFCAMKKLLLALAIAATAFGIYGVARAQTILQVPGGGTGWGNPGGILSGFIPVGNGLGKLATSSGLTFSTSTLKLTATYASTTGFSSLYASTTDFFGAGLTACVSNNVLTWTGGRFGCEADDTGASSYDAWTHPSAGVSATTSSIIITASSTIGSGTPKGGLTVSGGATTTGSLTVQGIATSTFSGPVSTGANHILTHGVMSDASDGLHIHANNGTLVTLLGAENSANATFYGGFNIDGATRLATSLSGLLGANSGTVYSFASSSLFGYTPLNPTRQLTVAGTAQQITSSAGAQDLSADRTWTLSLPNYVLFPNGYSAAIGSTTNATSTNLTATVLASTTNLIVSSAGGTAGCATFSANGTISNTGSACGGSGTFAWTPTTNFGATANATNTPIWFQAGLQASSTARLSGTIITPPTNTKSLVVYQDDTVNDPLALQVGADAAKLTASTIVQFNDPNNGSNSDWSFLVAGSGGWPTMNLAVAAGTLGTPTIVSSDRDMGSMDFFGYDGAAYIKAAQILADVDTTPGLNDMPGRITFSTTADGGSSPTERLVLDSAGVLKPATNDGLALGNTSAQFSDLFLASGGVINFGNGEVTLTPAANSLALAGGNFGIGSTSPFANLSIHAMNGDTNKTLFAIGSSTANATSTLFSVDNTGKLTLTPFADPNIIASGDFAINSTAASTSLRYHDGTAERVVNDIKSKSFVVSSSTLAYIGSFGAAGTTSILLWNPLHPVTVVSAVCKSNDGTAKANLNDGTNLSTMFSCSNSPSLTTMSANNTWVMMEDFKVDVGTSATSPDVFTITINYRETVE